MVISMVVDCKSMLKVIADKGMPKFCKFQETKT